MLSTTTSYLTINRDMQKSLQSVQKQPDVARESAYYLSKIGSVKTIDDLLADQRLYTYAMKAYGLDDMVYAKAFVRKVLTDGIDSPRSFANQLADPRFRDFAATFNFKATGRATTSFDRAQQGVVDHYLQSQLEQQAGSQNEGVRLALYFKRKAKDISSTYSILADAALLKVAQTALGLPAQMSSSNIETQAALIKSKLDTSKLTDPAYLSKFLSRFTNLWDATQGPSDQSAAALFGGSTNSLISPNTLMSIQALRGRGL